MMEGGSDAKEKREVLLVLFFPVEAEDQLTKTGSFLLNSLGVPDSHSGTSRDTTVKERDHVTRLLASGTTSTSLDNL